MGQRRRIRAVAESGAHQQRIRAALLQRNDRRVHAPRCEQPHGAERRLPQSDVQGHETLLQGQHLVRRRVGAARIQHLPGVCRRRGHLQGREHGRLQPADRPHAPQRRHHAGPEDRLRIRRRPELPPLPALRQQRSGFRRGVRQCVRRGRAHARGGISADRLATRRPETSSTASARTTEPTPTPHSPKTASSRRKDVRAPLRPH